MKLITFNYPFAHAHGVIIISAHVMHGLTSIIKHKVQNPRQCGCQDKHLKRFTVKDAVANVPDDHYPLQRLGAIVGTRMRYSSAAWSGA